ncbi:Invasion plasmid antigen (plasmid) [Shigella dysenteriae WRSd3]|uniref:Invasion plasmid antigen n=2 Tax=Shigella dysenteriae WRSd3 TaxID=1401327 RepID=A0A090N9B6_SHIDY|nr:Invasion plasmid antigen [Shigella dysenteriae WRSd3]ESU76140.1 Invasion plasmid antigen [Shigella dysenteriae WRSd3]
MAGKTQCLCGASTAVFPLLLLMPLRAVRTVSRSHGTISGKPSWSIRHQKAFYGVSGVTANDLRTAEATVRSREENEFTDWFSLWGPWHAVLKRTEADRWAQAEEQKYEMLENEYSQRVADRLKASGLSGDADAEREAGAQVMRETEQQIYRQLTDEVLALRLSENGSRLHHS